MIRLDLSHDAGLGRRLGWVSLTLEIDGKVLGKTEWDEEGLTSLTSSTKFYLVRWMSVDGGMVDWVDYGEQ